MPKVRDGRRWKTTTPSRTGACGAVTTRTTEARRDLQDVSSAYAAGTEGALAEVRRQRTEQDLLWLIDEGAIGLYVNEQIIISSLCP